MTTNSAGRRGPSPGVTILLTIAGLVLGGLFGACGGAIIGFRGSSPHGPKAPPSFDDDFPDVALRSLHGVTVSLIAERWAKKANKWTCAQETLRPLTGAKQSMQCRRPGEYDVFVDIEYDDETQVRLVAATCREKPGAAVCRSLFATVADAVFIPQPDLRKKASKWAGAHVDSDSAMVFGDIRAETSLEPNRLGFSPVA